MLVQQTLFSVMFTDLKASGFSATVEAPAFQLKKLKGYGFESHKVFDFTSSFSFISVYPP